MSNQFKLIKVPSLSKDQDEQAMELHKELVVFDASTAIEIKWVETTEAQYFKSALEVGVTAINNTAFSSHANFRHAVTQISAWYNVLEHFRDKIILTTTVEDIRKAKRDHKVAMIFGPQNTTMIEDDLQLLRIFHRLGIKICQLTYNEANLLGDGCTERTQRGLTDFGLQVLEEMNYQGILVDLSHCSDAVIADALECSKDAMAFTHVCCRAINGNPRNKTDEQLQALAEKGGVIGVAAWSPLTHTQEGIQPTLDDFFTHLTRIIETTGIDHVGIGSDLPFGAFRTTDPTQWEIERKKWPAVYGNWTVENKHVVGFDDVTSFPNVTKGLVALGYSKTEIRKIMGENFLKLCERVWGK
ncbi:MAG: dipeptidase [Candidatus Hodarchaeota archaeon]